MKGSELKLLRQLLFLTRTVAAKEIAGGITSRCWAHWENETRRIPPGLSAKMRALIFVRDQLVINKGNDALTRKGILITGGGEVPPYFTDICEQSAHAQLLAMNIAGQSRLYPPVMTVEEMLRWEAVNIAEQQITKRGEHRE